MESQSMEPSMPGFFHSARAREINLILHVSMVCCFLLLSSSSLYDVLP